LRAPALLCVLTLVGCTTEFTTIAPDVRPDAERLGHVRGVAHRHILFGTPTYNIIPLAWSGAVQRAVDRALAQAPGSDALVDVTLEEDWFWWVIGSARTTVLEGDAVKR